MSQRSRTLLHQPHLAGVDGTLGINETEDAAHGLVWFRIGYAGGAPVGGASDAITASKRATACSTENS